MRRDGRRGRASLAQSSPPSSARRPRRRVREATARPGRDGRDERHALAQRVDRSSCATGRRDPRDGPRRPARRHRPASLWAAEGGMTLLNASGAPPRALDASASADRTEARRDAGGDSRRSGRAHGSRRSRSSARSTSAPSPRLRRALRTLTAGVGPAGAYCASLGRAVRTRSTPSPQPVGDRPGVRHRRARVRRPQVEPARES